MDTLPTKFARYHRQVGTQYFWVVKISTGTESSDTTWWVSNVDMRINVDVPKTFSGTVLAHALLLDDDFRIEWAIDPVTRRWSIGGIDIRLSNKPYRGPRTARVRLSDEGLLEADDLLVELYLMAGHTFVDPVDDGYRVFTGYVVGEPRATADEIILTCEDIGTRLLDKMLPMTPMGDIWATHSLADRKLGLVLGDMRSREPFGGGHYMVPGYATITSGEYLCWFVDHLTAEDGDVWTYLEELDAWMKLDLDAMGLSFITTANGERILNGIDWSTDQPDLQGWLYLPPQGVSNFVWSTAALTNEGDYNPGMNKVQDAHLAYNSQTKSYAELYQCNTPGRANLQFYWPNYYDIDRAAGIQIEYRTSPPKYGRPVDPPREKGKHGTYQVKGGRLYYVYPKVLDWTMSEDDGDTPDDYGAYLVWMTEKNSNLTYTYGVSGTTMRTAVVVYRAQSHYSITPRVYMEDVYETSDMHDGSIHEMGLDNLAYNNHDGGWGMADDGVVARFPVYVSAATNEWMLRVKGVFMRCYVTTNVKLSEDVQIYFAPAGYPMDTQLAARRGNASVGDLCVWPGDQTEMLLRWPIGLNDDHIDMDSFDAAYSEDYATRAIITDENPQRVGDVLQELSENGNYCLFFDAAGKTRLIALDQPQGESPGPTTNAVIPYYDLTDSPELYQTEVDQVLNRIKVYYDCDPADGSFRGEETFTNSTSRAAYGLREHTAGLQLRYFDDAGGAGIDAFMAFAMTGTPSLLGSRHKGIHIETIGARWIHLQIGDWVELDAETTDDQISFHGATWAGEQFLIIGKTVTKNSVSFTAVQLI